MSKPLVIGHEANGLYIINTSKCFQSTASDSSFPCISIPNNGDLMLTTCNPSITKISPELLHCRMGHIPFSQLQYISSSDIMNKSDFICQICPKAKQHRQPFQISSSLASQPFELIHIDTWGPYRQQTYNGFHYFLTIVDDHTKCTWTYLMPLKSHAFSLL